VPEEVKARRLDEVIELQMKANARRTREMVGQTHRVLIESVSKKSDDELSGRNSQNTMVVFPKGNHKIGTYVNVYAEECTAVTLRGKVVN